MSGSACCTVLNILRDSGRLKKWDVTKDLLPPPDIDAMFCRVNLVTKDLPEEILNTMCWQSN